MRTVLVCAGANLRRRRRNWLGLALIAALAGGAVLAVLAGARRTDSAYHRFEIRQLAADVKVYPPFSPGTADLDFAKVEKLPQVATSARLTGFSADGAFTFALGGGYGQVVNVPKVLSGRLPHPDSLDEVAISFDFAGRRHLHVGSWLPLHFKGASPVRTPGASGPGLALKFKVVGIEALPGEFPPKLQGSFPPEVYVSQGFRNAHLQELRNFEILVVRLHRGPGDVTAFEAGLRGLAGNVPISDFRGAAQASNVQRGIHLQAVALWMLGGFLGLAAGLVLGQLLSRQSQLDADANSSLRALGMTRGQLWLSGMAPVAATGAIGAVLAVVLAVAASPLFPIGTARAAEPELGLAVDPLVLGACAVAVVAAMLVLAAWPLWRAASPDVGASAPTARERPPVLARAATAVSLPSTASVGMTLALRRGEGRTAVPVRSSITAVAMAVAALAAAVTFGASLTHLLSTPRLYGWNWDAGITDNGQTGIEPLIPMLQADARLEAVAVVDSGVPLRVGNSDVAGLGVDNRKGRIDPVVLQGRAPQAKDEIALGARTFRDTGARLGGQVPLSITAVESTPTPKRIVGTVVVPPTNEGARLGAGAFVTYDAELTLLPPGVEPPVVIDAIVRFTPGVDRARLLADLRRLAGSEYSVLTPQAPTDIVNFGRIQNLPLILAGLLAVLAAATLAHTLVTSVYRRDRDLAILKTLGFTPAQVRQAVAWQSSTLSLVALLAGLPLGIALGRVLWTVLAGQLGTLPEAVTPALSLGAILPAGLLIANLTAAIPAYLAARTKPALVLRRE